MPETTKVTKTRRQDFEHLVYTSPVAIYTCDQDGYITFFNKAAVELWGHAPVIGKDLWCGSWKMYYPNGDPMPKEQSPMALTLKQLKLFEGEEIVIERKDNSFRNLLVFPQPVFDEEGILTSAQITLVDITAQKKGEEKQSTLSAIVESSDDAIVSKSLNGIITSWNAGAQRIFEYTEAEIIGRPINVLIPHHLQEEEEVIISSIKAGKKVDHFRTIRLSKSGNEIPVSITVSPVKDQKGIIIGASKIARDISEQLRKEEIIKQASRRFEILNSIGRTISTKLDAESILQRVTDATTLITGAAFGAFIYNTIDEGSELLKLFTVSGFSREVFEKIEIPGNMPTFNGKGVVRIDDITKDLNSEKKGVHFGLPIDPLAVTSYLAVPVTSVTGNVLGGLFFGHPEPNIFKVEHEDILISIASQASVALDNSRLFEEVKGLNTKKDEFIALASHELKTPLTSIKGYLQILQQKNTNEQEDKTSRMFIEKSLKQVDRLNQLVSDLFDISKIEAGRLELAYEYFDLKDLISEVIEIHSYSTITHKIYFESPGELVVRADRQRMEQVIINLLTNAIKYSPEADKILVELFKDDDNAYVKIVDEGKGLTSDQQKSIFKRFYRVEGNANISGLGLGLYISKEIIDQHHGEIKVISEPGKGSTFIFSIPVK